MSEKVDWIYLPRSENESGLWLNLATIAQIIEFDDGAVVVLFSSNERRLPVSPERAYLLISTILETCPIQSKKRHEQSRLKA